MEMYLAGVSVRRVEDITERCGARGCGRRMKFGQDGNVDLISLYLGVRDCTHLAFAHW
jgi:hypothetical protein